jgi:hypothetical protein
LKYTCLIITIEYIFFVAEETATNAAHNEEEMGTISVDDPLLRYTNHERHASEIVDSMV